MHPSAFPRSAHARTLHSRNAKARVPRERYSRKQINEGGGAVRSMRYVGGRGGLSASKDISGQLRNAQSAGSREEATAFSMSTKVIK